MMSDSTERFARRLEAKYRVGLALIAGLVFMVAVTAAFSNNRDKSAAPDPSTTTSAVAKKGLPGFTSVAFTITPSVGGAPIEHCGLLAESQQQLNRGLKEETDIGGYVAMVFRFAADTQSKFYMFNVPVPLAIAWFDEQGKFVSSSEMEPCKVEELKCPQYPAAGPYRYAIETKAGGLASMGISEGSVLQVGAPGCV